MMSPAPIQTSQQAIIVEGNVFYTDKRRRIELKKPIRDLFEVSINPVNYKMEVCLCENSILERVKHLVKKNVRPILLYFEEPKQ